MKYLLPTLTFLVASSVFSQKQYKFPEKFNSFYDFKPDDAYALILKNNPNEDKKELDFFAVNYVYAEQFAFDFNQVYMDWVDVENYFIKIMDKVLPKNIQKRNMSFFLARSLVENAHASRFGNLYLNMGMFCVAENEAFIAGVLAHEAGHYFFNHNITSMKEYSDMKQYVGFGSSMFVEQSRQARERYFRMKRLLEYQADTFAISCLARSGISLRPLLNYQEQEDMREQVSRFSRSYQNMLKASSLSEQEISKRKKQMKDNYATHGSSIERYDLVKQAYEKCDNCDQNFFVDSVFFRRLKVIAREERKKISMESASFDECSLFAAVDYMYEPKNLKNLYYLFEAIRRQLIIRPELSEKGFLSDLVNDDYLYYNNKSIFHKPQYILNDSRLYDIMKDHPFVKDETKPFETYEQAFLFFAHQARNLNFNEANLSLGLYYHHLSVKDSAVKYLQLYVTSGNGLYKGLAESILKNGQPIIQKGKSLILYSNLGTYTGGSYNYYQAKQQMQNNVSLKEMFGRDTLHTDFILMGELLGKRPYQLQEMKKLMTAVTSFYNEEDIQTFKKIRLTSRFAGEDSPLATTCKKHLFVYAPEWYNWFTEHNYDKLFFADVVYQYSGFADEKESFNTYTGYYLDFNAKRPYFRDASRVGVNFKQKEKEIQKELYSFLYE